MSAASDLGKVSHENELILFSGVTRINCLKPNVFRKRIRGLMCRELFSKRISMDLETMFIMPAELVFNLDEIGIDEWEDHHEMRVVGQTIFHGVHQNLKHISAVA
jgi:hypothetical protein